MLRLALAVFGCAAACAAPARAYVYWTNPGVGNSSNGTTLGRVNLDGSGVNHALITGAATPAGIAVDASHIYWADQQDNAIGRANLDGSGPNHAFIPNATSGSSTAPNSVALDGTYVYWTDGARYIGRAKLDGSGLQPHFIDVGPSSFPIGVAISAGTLYITDSASILHVSASGGAPQLVVTLPGSATPTSLAVAGGYLYWSALNLGNPSPSGTIGRALISGAGLDENFIPNLNFPSGVATDGTELYWVDHGPSANTIGRALLGTTGATNIQPNFTSEPGGPWGVAVDALIDPTQTAVTCSPARVSTGTSTTCTATVSDPASSAAPTGSIVFSSDGTVFFSGSASCTLAPRPGGGASCVVGAVPAIAGNPPINVSYGGDGVHSPSTGATTVCAGAQCFLPGATPPSSPAPPSSTAPPSISGAATVGQTLSCSQGSWSATAPIAFVYQWQRDGGPISGATGSSYKIATADAGHGLSCKVTATNGAGSASSSSGSVAVTTPRPTTARAGRAKLGSGGAASVSLSCAGPVGTECTIALAIGVVETFSGKKLIAITAAKTTNKVLVLAAKTLSITAGQHKTVTLALSRSGKRLLSRAHRLKVRLTIKQLTGGGHSTVISSQTLTVKKR
jgi:hypothetical protein